MAIVGEYSTDREPDGYLVGWFRGDLADEVATDVFPPLRAEPSLHGWAEPTSELLHRLLDGLRKHL